MAEGIHELTATGRQKKPSEELTCQWIGEAWCDIPREMVVRSFSQMLWMVPRMIVFLTVHQMMNLF